MISYALTRALPRFTRPITTYASIYTVPLTTQRIPCVLSHTRRHLPPPLIPLPSPLPSPSFGGILQKPHIYHIAARATPGKNTNGEDSQNEGTSNQGPQKTNLSVTSPFGSFLINLFRWVSRWIFTALGSLALLVALAIGFTPAILSHPAGLQATLGIVNTMTPLHVEVDYVIAQWQQPLEIHGVRIKEKVTRKRKHTLLGRKQENGASAEQQSSSSSLEPRENGNDFFSSSTLRTSSRSAETGRKLENSVLVQDEDQDGAISTDLQSSSTSSTTPLSPTLGTTLVEFDRIRSISTLFNLISGNPSDIIISYPQIDVTLNPSGNLKLLQTLQDAGLTPVPYAKETPKSSSSSQHAQQDEEYPQITTSVPVPVPQSLQQVAEEVPFSGELRIGSCHVALTSGRLRAPAGLRDILGDSTHFEVLLGDDVIEEVAQEEESRVGFVVAGEENEGSSIGEWARHKPIVDLPKEVGKQGRA